MASSLQDFIETVNGTGHLRIEHDFGDGFVRLQTSEAERRQAAQDIQCSEHIVLELLRNSRDAHAKNIFVAMAKEGDRRTLVVIDDGDGIPEPMHSLVFEPRVTSKLDTSHMDTWGLHGRGMALYSIKVNADTANVALSKPGLGTSIVVTSTVTILKERTDQSSFPTFELSEAGKVNVRGPRNILRTTAEFAIDSRSSCSVYIGSPAEICATLYGYGMATLSTVERIFCNDVSALPLVKRLATAADPESFAEMAGQMGLSISSRTARRIMDGQLAELDSVLDRITISQPAKKSTKKKSPNNAVDNRGLKLMHSEKKALAAATSRAFKHVAEKYYLEPDVDPTVTVRKDRIVITVPVVKKP